MIKSMINFFKKTHPIGQFIVIYQLLFLLALPFYLYFGTVQLSVCLIAFVLYFITGICITGGYHRLYSHRSYKAHPVVEAFILFFGTLAAQGSVIRWSYDHRLHHAYVDTDNDPYSINKGFWYAHFLWLLETPRTIQPKVVKDLYDNKWVSFQHEHYLSLVIGVNALVFLFFGYLLNDYMGAFILILWGRMFALHHSTWFINSLAHTWGNKPFSQEQSAVNNFIISLLTFGEGYHNYHHTFANDYRNGIRWFHFDPTKWMIWTFNKLGLAFQLKFMDPATIKKRMVIEHKQVLSERLQNLFNEKYDELEKKVDAISSELILHLNQWSELRNRLALSEDYRAVKKELKAIKTRIRNDWYEWKRLSRYILKLKPQKV